MGPFAEVMGVGCKGRQERPEDVVAIINDGLEKIVVSLRTEVGEGVCRAGAQTPPRHPVEGSLQTGLVSKGDGPPPTGGGIEQAGYQGGPTNCIKRAVGEPRGLEHLKSIQ